MQKDRIHMKKTFLKYDKPLITSMVQGQTPERVKELCDASRLLGAEALGMQFERLLPEYRRREVYEELFSYTDMPVYATNYRVNENNGKSDETLAEELLELSQCGATLCDVVGDLFDKQPDELAESEEAVSKQMKLIESLHRSGSEVLISSHVFKFTPAERVLEMALEHKNRGADISKIVVGAENAEEEIENLKILRYLKENMTIPFLFLSVGESRMVRRFG